MKYVDFINVGLIWCRYGTSRILIYDNQLLEVIEIIIKGLSEG
jgi:hypothetical protein